MVTDYAYVTRRSEGAIRRFLYVWRPLILSVGTAALVVGALAYLYAVHSAIREQLAEEVALNARLTEMLSGPVNRREVVLAHVDTRDMGRAEILIRPSGR